MFGAKMGTFERAGLSPRDYSNGVYAKSSRRIVDKVRERERASGRELYRSKQMLLLVDFLLQAASSKQRFEPVRWSLMSWFLEAARTFQLEEATKEAYHSHQHLDWQIMHRCDKFTARRRAQAAALKKRGRDPVALEREIRQIEAAHSTASFLTERFDRMFRSAFRGASLSFRWQRLPK
jgi:hypothetical protein